MEPPSLPPSYRDRSGIYRIGRPPDIFGTDRDEDLIPLLAERGVPTFFDQLYSYTTAAELLGVAFGDEVLTEMGLAGAPREQVVAVLAENGPSDDELTDVIKELPLEPGMRLMPWLQRMLRLHPTDAQRQIALMRSLYAEQFAEAAMEMLRRFPRRALFTEQQVFAMQRLLLLHAEDRPADDLSRREQAKLLMVLLWIPDRFLDPDLDVDERLTGWDLDDDRLLRFFVTHSTLASHTAFRHELARAHRLYAVIATSRAARRHRDYCPLNEWLLEEYGLDFIELQTFGFGFFAQSKIGDRGDAPLQVTNHEYFAPTPLAERYDRALAAIAGTREWFQEAFVASTASARHAAYEVQPFFRRPVFLQRDGNAVVLGLRPMESWLGATGAYYRFLDLARARGEDTLKRFSRFNGWLQERYVRHLTHVAHPYPRQRRLSGSGRVIPEQRYRVKHVGELMTSDVAIDLGTDLVLIEVTAKRVTLKSIVEGDMVSVVQDVTRLVIENMKQIGRVVTDLTEGRAALPGIDAQFVRRVWPVIVSPDGLFHSPTLRAWCDRRGGHLLENPPEREQEIQPFILLDAEEFEVLMALVADGVSLVKILESKTSPLWRDRDFKAWFLDSGVVGEDAELGFLGDESKRLFHAMKRALTVPD
jgi:hypothetical protein